MCWFRKWWTRLSEHARTQPLKERGGARSFSFSVRTRCACLSGCACTPPWDGKREVHSRFSCASKHAVHAIAGAPPHWGQP